MSNLPKRSQRLLEFPVTWSRLIAATAICASTATTALADVTLRYKTTSQPVGSGTMDTTEYRKGLKLRMDIGPNDSQIIDAGAGRSVILFHATKIAEVTVWKPGESLPNGSVPEDKPTYTPTPQTRQIAGSTCIVHNFTWLYRLPSAKMGPSIALMHGTMCLVKDPPGQADFAAFYQATGNISPVWPDPAIGVLFASEIAIDFKGDRPEANVTASPNVVELVSISTAPIPDSLFEIPADYKVVTR